MGSLSIMFLTVSKKGVVIDSGCDVNTKVDNVPKIVRGDLG